MLLLSVLVRFLGFLNDLHDLRDFRDKPFDFSKIVGVYNARQEAMA